MISYEEASDWVSTYGNRINELETEISAFDNAERNASSRVLKSYYRDMKSRAQKNLEYVRERHEYFKAISDVLSR